MHPFNEQCCFELLMSESSDWLKATSFREFKNSTLVQENSSRLNYGIAHKIISRASLAFSHNQNRVRC